jgi:hypothetical protein
LSVINLVFCFFIANKFSSNIPLLRYLINEIKNKKNMKKIKITPFAFITIMVIAVSACKKDTKTEQTEPIITATTNSITLNFTNVVDNQVLKISDDVAYVGTTPKYLNAFGDTFAVSSFKYYISNIKLKKGNGSYFIENESYHLLDAGDTVNTCKIKLKNVPFDDYTAIEFVLGIDSVRNKSGAQSGDLDPSKGMYWAWNQGYIFMRFFGYSSEAPLNSSHNITYEIGENSSARTITLPFNTNNLSVQNGNSPKIYLKTNLSELFKNPNTVSFSFLNSAMTTKQFQPLVDNYSDLFSISAIKH